MIHINGKADQNDISKVLKHHKEEDIAAVQPCPRNEDGKINPHATKFILKNGQYVSIFHVKPVYYETLDGQWRPMEEVAHGFGNCWIDFKADWADKMHPRYMAWLVKRASFFKQSDIKIRSPYGYPITIEQEAYVSVT